MFSLQINFLLIFIFHSVESRHFLGGTISWKVLNNENQTSSSVPVTFTQSYQWKESATYCNQSLIFVYPPVSVNPDILQCVSPTSLCGGYTTLSTQGYCMDSSLISDTRSSYILHTENITVGSKFCVAFQNMNWMVLQAPSCNTSCPLSSAGWSIGSCIDLTIRLGGFVNTSPVANMISPVKVPVNSTTNIKIPVLDADNDILRCRWAKKTSALDECGDVCGTILGSQLDRDNCVLSFNSTGKTVGDFFAVTLMVEDFPNATSNTSLSSVPIQFLIEIVASPLCVSKPMINLNLSQCVAIQVGMRYNFTVIIDQGCPNTSVIDLITVSPLYMSKSSPVQIGSNHQWSVSYTWIPTVEQIGPQIYCAMAIDSVNMTSDQLCTAFTVVDTNQNLLCPGETTTSTSTSSSSSTSTSSTSTSTATSTTSIKSTDDSRLLLLGLGLGIPVLALLSGLIVYCCCCVEQCNLLCGRCRRRFRNRTEDIQNEIFIDQRNENSSDYRSLYINDRNPSPIASELPNDNSSHRNANTSILIEAYRTQTNQRTIHI
ncbi:unnamed protein product [Adineta ricciae]|uniref:Uncharacterized protein n=1 Tax=Adineta ricciae TaxID=249248 RepID=A0A814PSG3_ADIRI|nr:unnamed protein product [Adineta ricciae]CAF1109921.1 unnamed protein product [Adineta ricciae]